LFCQDQKMMNAHLKPFWIKKYYSDRIIRGSISPATIAPPPGDLTFFPYLADYSPLRPPKRKQFLPAILSTSTMSVCFQKRLAFLLAVK